MRSPRPVAVVTVYEVHVSAAVGVIEPFRLTPTPDGLRSSGSLLFRTEDLPLAESVVATWGRTARRAEDRHAWIREATR